MDFLPLVLAATLGFLGRFIAGIAIKTWETRDEIKRRNIIKPLLGEYYIYRLHTTKQDYVEIKLEIKRTTFFGHKFKWRPLGLNGENKESAIVFSGPARFIENRIVLKGEDYTIVLLDTPVDASRDMRIGVFGGVRHHNRMLYAGLLFATRNRLHNKEAILGLLKASEQDGLTYVSEGDLHLVQQYIKNTPELSNKKSQRNRS